MYFKMMEHFQTICSRVKSQFSFARGAYNSRVERRVKYTAKHLWTKQFILKKKKKEILGSNNGTRRYCTFIYKEDSTEIKGACRKAILNTSLGILFSYYSSQLRVTNAYFIWHSTS